jgi:transposase
VPPVNVTEIIEADAIISIPAHQRKKPGRKPLPKDLPRIQKYYDLEESEKVCNCGCLLSKIGEERSEQLDIIPAKMQIIEHIKLKYACTAL